MQTFKLVHLVQYHSDKLSDSLLRRVQMCDRAPSYCNVSPVELKDRVSEIYHHLGSWLLDKSESDIDQRYTAIGARRTGQDVPLSELVWVVLLTKSTLYEFIDDVSIPGATGDNAEKQELLRRLDGFFDQAVYATVVGYETAAKPSPSQAGIQARVKTRKAS